MVDKIKFGDRIGIMQGRLSPMVGDRIQAFPTAEWREEFGRAAAIGLSSIEWIFETPMEENPLWSEAGLNEILGLEEETGVGVSFVCADIFMESPFVRMTPEVRERNRAILSRLIVQGSKLGITGIEIPCVDASEIRTSSEEEELLEAIVPCLDLAGEHGLEIGLETSLAPEPFRDLLTRRSHPVLRANYDTGNSASLGYDTGEELNSYGSLINNVHIKDRVRNGSTVPLGEGHAEIPRTLRLLKECGYRGELILQAARGASDDCTLAASYRQQLISWIECVD
jgi:hexulose-6-phosphate isomerase